MAKSRKPKSKKRGTDAHAIVEATKAEFKAAHEAGMKALDSYDFKGVRDAIERERNLIEEQAKLVERQRKKLMK
jgi:cytosine/adenosine deaminase-related metal-dependent hydrolase